MEKYKLDYWDSCVVLAIKGWHYNVPELSSDSIKDEIAKVLAERNGCDIEHIKDYYITEYLIDIIFKFSSKDDIKRVLHDSLSVSWEAYFPTSKEDMNKKKGLFEAIKSYLRFTHQKPIELHDRAMHHMKNDQGLSVVEWKYQHAMHRAKENSNESKTPN
jgi:hypothetical protein